MGNGLARAYTTCGIIILNRTIPEQVVGDVQPLKYSAVIERDEDGVYVASIPELPGCHSQARNLDELTLRIKEAAELYLEVADGETER